MLIDTETRSDFDRRPSKLRSRVSNGSLFIEAGVDGRSAWARRLKDLIEAHTADLGGEGNISAAEQAIIRRAAALICECEVMEARFAKNEGASPSDLDLYQRTANGLRRLLESLGLGRRARDVTPPGGDYNRLIDSLADGEE